MLTVSRSHAVMDGIAFFEFMETWARIAKESDGQDNEEGKEAHRKEVANSGPVGT